MGSGPGLMEDPAHRDIMRVECDARPGMVIPTGFHSYSYAAWRTYLH
jgi:hypothetical protein